MQTNFDLFLLLAHLSEYQPSKIFTKKLYSFSNNLTEIFNGNVDNLKAKLSIEEIQKLKMLKGEIKKINLNETKKKLDNKGIGFLSYCEKDYPGKLQEIPDPPFGLFYKGNLDLLNKKSVAIVGTRNATNYGLRIAKEISTLLVKQGLIIVSGLASGIDTSAHQGAIENGKTIGVFGTGVDIIFPASNTELYYKILEKGGLIISEYPPGTEGIPWNFPQRNRIISALSNAVIIIEGNLDSGAMITARFAIKQGKPLFALPGLIDSPQSNGTNILIKSGVAELLTSVNDVLEKIGESKQTSFDLNIHSDRTSSLTEKQKNIYNKLSSNTKDFDPLLQETKLSTQELIKELSILELKGLIEKTLDGGYVKC